VARTVAAFDFDGTISKRDTVMPFLARVVGWRRVFAVALIDAPRLALMAIGRGDRDAAKERMLVKCLGGLRRDVVAREGNAYATEVFERKLRRPVVETLERHRRDGHEVVLVSASLDVYLDEIGRDLGVNAVLCTRLEVDDDGRITGRMLGGNCRGANKVTRLREYLGDESDDLTLYAYGNSSGDDELLALADHPVRV
jgi:HAD superfamily hydrolase (TIGR01490 family)